MKSFDVFQEYAAQRPYFLAFVRSLEIPFYGKGEPLTGKVLDFGCGDGYFLQTLKQFCPELLPDKVYGLDMEASLISPSPYETVTLYNGEKIPFGNRSFDHAISNCVFEHVPALDKTLSELHRVIKPQGRLVITVMGQKWNEYLRLPGLFWDKVQKHYHHLSRQEWRELLTKHGFKTLRAEDYITRDQARFVELGHFGSLPYLISKKLINNWGAASIVYRPLFQSRLLKEIISQKARAHQGAAIFFELERV